MEIKKIECHNLYLHNSAYSGLLRAFSQWYKKPVTHKKEAHVNTIKKAINHYTPSPNDYSNHKEHLLDILALIKNKNGVIRIKQIDYSF